MSNSNSSGSSGEVEDFPEDPHLSAFQLHEVSPSHGRTLAVTVESSALPSIVVDAQEALELNEDSKSGPYLTLIHDLYFF